MKNKIKISFDEYICLCEYLIHQKEGYNSSIKTVSTHLIESKEHYFDCFKIGLTPEEAVIEDFKHHER